jgi:hypothetical protein
MQNNVWKKELTVIVIGLFIAMGFNLPVNGNEFMDNHPPEIPQVRNSGGYEGEPSYIEFNTTDPDGDDVYYYIQWGDGTKSGWLGPYKSGEIVQANHTWENIGVYYLNIYAKDIYEATSKSGGISIRIIPHLEVKIQDGFGIGATVTVRNLGIRDYENILWTFGISRPKYFRYGAVSIILKHGTIKSLKIGEERTIRIGVIFRFTLRGHAGFYLNMEPFPGDFNIVECGCIIIGPFFYTF